MTQVLLEWPRRGRWRWGWRIRLEFKLADMWLGVFWQRDKYGLDVWVCLLPTLPLHLTVLRRQRRRVPPSVARGLRDGTITDMSVGGTRHAREG